MMFDVTINSDYGWGISFPYGEYRPSTTSALFVILAIGDVFTLGTMSL